MFQTFLVQPIYNVFVFLVGVMPQGDVGLAIIAITLIIRALFYPTFASQIRTQIGMQAAQKEIDEINKKYKDDPKVRAERTMALFRERGLRPFSSILTIIVQIPVFLALYWAFFQTRLPELATGLLYSFVPVPEAVSIIFFGLMDLTATGNILLASLVAILQYLVAHLSLARVDAPAGDLAPERAAAHNMQKQMMLYFLPALMGITSYFLPSAAGLYFAASGVFSLGQEFLIRRQLAHKR